MGPGVRQTSGRGGERLFVMCQSHHEHPFVSTALSNTCSIMLGAMRSLSYEGVTPDPHGVEQGGLASVEQMFAIALRPIYAVVQTGVRVARAPTAEGATMAEVLSSKRREILEFIAECLRERGYPPRCARSARPSASTPRRPSTPIWPCSNVRATSSATPPSPAPSRFASTLRRRSRWPPPHALRPVGR